MFTFGLSFRCSLMPKYKCTKCDCITNSPELPEGFPLMPNFCPNCIKDAPTEGSIDSLKKYCTLEKIEDDECG